MPRSSCCAVPLAVGARFQLCSYEIYAHIHASVDDCTHIACATFNGCTSATFTTLILMCYISGCCSVCLLQQCLAVETLGQHLCWWRSQACHTLCAIAAPRERAAVNGFVTCFLLVLALHWSTRGFGLLNCVYFFCGNYGVTLWLLTGLLWPPWAEESACHTGFSWRVSLYELSVCMPCDSRCRFATELSLFHTACALLPQGETYTYSQIRICLC